MKKSSILALPLIFVLFTGYLVGNNTNQIPADYYTKGPITHRKALIAFASQFINSRAYKSWSRFKIGTSIEYTLTFSNDAEGTTKLPLYYTLSELNADEAVIDRNLPAGSKQRYPAKIKPGEEPAAGLLSPCALLFKKVQGKEIISVSGDNLSCTFGEVEKNTGGKEKGMQWASDQVPGGLVKLQVKTVDDGKTTVWNMTLDKINIIQ